METENSAELQSAADAAQTTVAVAAGKPTVQPGALAELNNPDVDDIRAVLSRSRRESREVHPALWIGVAVALLLLTILAWQWQARAQSAADTVAPPEVVTPKPPDFALETPAPIPTQIVPLAAHAAPSRHGRRRHHSGN